MIESESIPLNQNVPQPPRVVINLAGKTICRPDWKWTLTLPDYDLLIVQAGRGEYYDLNKGETFSVQAGTCLLLRKGTRYVGKMDLAYPMTMIWIHFDFLESKGHRAFLDLLPPVYNVPSNPRFIYSLGEKVLNWHQKSQSIGAHWLEAVLLELVDQYQLSEFTGQKGQQAKLLQQLYDEITQQPEKRWRLNGMAKRFHCSVDHFSRIFRRFALQSPGDLVIKARLNASMDLLRSSSYSISRISEMLGYSDSFAFSRQFHRKIGLTPTEYRRSGGTRN